MDNGRLALGYDGQPNNFTWVLQMIVKSGKYSSEKNVISKIKMRTGNSSFNITEKY